MSWSSSGLDSGVLSSGRDAISHAVSTAVGHTADPRIASPILDGWHRFDGAAAQLQDALTTAVAKESVGSVPPDLAEPVRQAATVFRASAAAAPGLPLAAPVR